MNKKIDFRMKIEKFIYFFVNKLVILTILDEYSIIHSVIVQIINKSQIGGTNCVGYEFLFRWIF